MTEEILAQLSEPPIIDKHSKALTKIVFPNGTINYVFHAHRDSKCEALSQLHQYLYDEEGMDIQDLLNAVPDSEWEKDKLGGGRYLPIGFGTRSTFKKCKRKGVPHMRKPFKVKTVQTLSTILGGIMSRVGRCVSKYSSHAMKMNRQFKNKNETVAFPLQSDQDLAWNYFSNQMIIRNFGPTKLSDNIATHYDPGDVDTLMPLAYKSGGGIDDRGGPVAGTDIILFEGVTGGAAARVKTNIVDTVVVILTNSRTQLHGGVLSEPDFVYDSTAKSIRFIPFITVGVNNRMNRSPEDAPCRCFC